MAAIAPAPPDVETAGQGTILDEKVRMRINGETKRQMEHARQMKDQRPDTTVDDVWEVDQSLKSADSYIMWCTYPYLLTKMLILFIPLFIVTLPIAILARIYAAFLPTPTDKVKRAAPGFALFVLLSSPFVLVVLVFVALSRASDGFFYYLFGVPYMLLSKDGWGRRKRSIATIRPYMGGPRIRILDVLVCALGHTLRNGFLEWCWCFAVMIIAIPWMKYWVNANTLVYDLSERYVQQISTSMTDCGVDSVQDSARRIISRTKQDKDFQNRLDLWNFCPHYP